MPRTPDFDALYGTDPDPFDVGGSWYEQRKIAVTLAALTRARYRRAWDAAAGSGHLARELTDRCDAVVASDASRVAVDALREAGPATLTAVHSALPDRPDSARDADLVVVSEVLYYLDAAQRRATLDLLAGLSSEIVCVQWRHLPHDAHLSGDAALAELRERLEAAGFRCAVAHEEQDFVLAVLLPPTRPTPEPPEEAP